MFSWKEFFGYLLAVQAAAAVPLLCVIFGLSQFPEKGPWVLALIVLAYLGVWFGLGLASAGEHQRQARERSRRR